MRSTKSISKPSSKTKAALAVPALGVITPVTKAPTVKTLSGKKTTAALSLSPKLLAPIRAALKKDNTHFSQTYTGPSHQRQPVHTVYGGAHLFTTQTARKMSDVALRTLETYAPNGVSLARALGEPENDLWIKVYSRVVAKLKKEAVEDFRIDFEDGYGNRSDEEEDGHAQSCAHEVAAGMKDGSLPPFIGIRIKPFSEECVTRSMRTTDIFLTTLLNESKGQLPTGFVITLPKITTEGQSKALALFLAAIEKKNRLKAGVLKFELMVETPQAVLDEEGKCPLLAFVKAGAGRCVGAHFGTYDYTAGVGITAAHQTMANPVCDFAKHMMQVSLAGTPILLSDGATNLMPVGPHRATAGLPLSRSQLIENEQVVHHAWSESYDHIRYSLETGFYQGWDLHPAQLPIRYATVYSFFLESLPPAQKRLKAFIEKAAKASLLGDVFDDAATGQGLLNFFLRGIACGAITEDEALATGLTLNEIRSQSFLRILEGRVAAGQK